VPLVVPEVNPERIADYKSRGIISNPNCSTIQMVVILKPLHDAAQIERVVVSTYQSTSGAGRRAMDELFQQTCDLFNQHEPVVERFPYRIAFNCLPHIDVFLEDAYSKEEEKMIKETQKILEDASIKVTATTVRVPTFTCHAESVNVQFKKEMPPDKAKEVLVSAPGVIVMDDPGNNLYPTSLDATDRDEVFVGRIRKDQTVPYGLNLWIVADNLRKGAATNAVQIAEILLEKYI